MSKSIALLAVMALALCSAAQGQSITWVEKGGTTGSSLYLPRLARRLRKLPGRGPAEYGSGFLGIFGRHDYDCTSAHAICWNTGHDDRAATKCGIDGDDGIAKCQTRDRCRGS